MLASDISVATAHLFGLWLQIFATGAYCVYLIQCIPVLRRRFRENRSLWLPIASGLIFAITVTALATDMDTALRAYAIHGDGRPDPVTVYTHSASPVSLAKNAVIVIMSIISDAIIVYRTYVIWNSTFSVVVIPIGLLLTDVALGSWSVWTLAQTANDNDPIEAAVTLRVRYYFILTLCLNLWCAILICWKIWRVSSRIPEDISGLSKQRPTMRVFEIIVETASFYCAHLIAIIVTNCIESNTFFLLLDPLPPVTALVFSMIIVRASSGNRYGETTGHISTSLRFWTTTDSARDTTNDQHGPGLPSAVTVELRPTRSGDIDLRCESGTSDARKGRGQGGLES
ncbi:hypothetical protein C8Q76DRAFT_723817 [Earliella scabrosa]|nr:hypothetical protein C8Q76DRAFT_723817 [Earliella scabrosa]